MIYLVVVLVYLIFCSIVVIARKGNVCGDGMLAMLIGAVIFLGSALIYTNITQPEHKPAGIEALK